MASFSPHPLTNAERDRSLAAADGYAELGLPDFAWQELEALSPADRSRPDVEEFTLGYVRRLEQDVAGRLKRYL